MRKHALSFVIVLYVALWIAVLLVDIGSVAPVVSTVGVAVLLLWGAGFPDDAGIGADLVILALLSILSVHATIASELDSVIVLGVTVAASSICVRRWAYHYCGSRALIRLIVGLGMTTAFVWLAGATSSVLSALIAALVWVPAVLLIVGFVARSQFVGRLIGNAQGSRSGTARPAAR